MLPAGVRCSYNEHGEAAKKWAWLRAETAKTLENQQSRRCLSQFLHSLGEANNVSSKESGHDQHPVGARDHGPRPHRSHN
jgi:hypothetical protein